jgi:pseudouridine synthase
VKIRLQKILASRGLASRRGAEDLIARGLVKVNGQVVTQMGVLADPDVDRIEVDQPALEGIQAGLCMVMLNKPAGYATTRDEGEGRIVMQLVASHPKAGELNPVGRLDRDSCGLLLLTNDGRLGYSLLDPETHQEKEYVVEVEPAPTRSQLEKMASGLVLDGTKTRPAKVVPEGPSGFRIILTEGRNRQIRRMAQKVGLEVTSLKRVRVGSVRLGGLSEGKWRELTGVEVESLRKGVRARKEKP